MGEIVQLAEVRARKARTGAAARAAEELSGRSHVFETVECGSGWYHGEAIRASKEPPSGRAEAAIGPSGAAG